MTIGEKILNLRKARGWSQEELADRLGVTRQAVSRWESGSAKPAADKIVALCDLFGVSADYLLGRNGEDKHASSTNEGMTAPESLRGHMIGCLFVMLGVLVPVLLWIMSELDPVMYTIGGNIYHGFQAYIRRHDLGWLLAVAVFCFFLGIWNLLGQKRKRWIKDYLRCFWHDITAIFRTEK